MQHFETYEWALYLNGELSPRRTAEMEEHLASCDECLEIYAALACGEKPLAASETSLVQRMRWSLWEFLFRSVPRRVACGFAAAALVLTLVFLTPTGKTAWGQVTRTLREWFAVQSHPELVEMISASAVTADGIDIKLEEVLIEDGWVYLSLNLSAGRPISNETHYIGYLNDGLVINGVGFDLMEESDYESQSPAHDRQELKPSILVVLRAEVPERYLEGDAIPMTLRIDRVSDYSVPPGNFFYGPWVFDFTVDGMRAKELTRRAALDRTFENDGTTFQLKELLISPIRTKIRLSRTVPRAKKVLRLYKGGSWTVDPYGNLTGFILEDERGNRIEITQPDSNYTGSSEFVQSLDGVFYSRGSGNNGWEWLKDAKRVTVTPVLVTLDGPKKDAVGLDRYEPLEPFTVELR